MPQNAPKPRLPKGGWIVLALALLALAANFILTQIGSGPLPDAITDMAESVVTTSVQQLHSDAPRATPTSQVQATAAPAPSTADHGIWQDVEANFDTYILALSWEPAFCETKPHRKECVTQSADRFDADNFILHGLWPDDGDNDYDDTSYCDLSQSVIQQDKAGGWCDLPALSLSDPVAEDLFILMPGATSCLQNHEWYKHGTCSELTPEAYCALSNHLTALFAQTQFNAYVADRVGTEVTRRELLDQFEAVFGAGSDQYLSLQCDKVQGISLLTELYITVRQDIDAEDSFGELFPDKDVRPQGNCPQRFRIDAVGLGDY